MYKKISLFFIGTFLSLSLSACGIIELVDFRSLYNQIKYYKQQENYIMCTGIIKEISCTEDLSKICIEIENIEPNEFQNNKFYICGKGKDIVESNGIYQDLKTGDKIKFMSASRFYGDEYVVPIVYLEKEGEIYLTFHDGYNAFMEILYHDKTY